MLRPPSSDALIGVGVYEEHNAGFAAVCQGKVLQYAELERHTRVKNQAGWMPDLLAEFLNKLPTRQLGAICAPRPDAVMSMLIEHFGATPVEERKAAIDGHVIDLLDQDDLHGYFHMLSMLVLPGLDPGLYAVLIADADQARVGWIDLREPLCGPVDFRLMPPTKDRWFNGEIFSGMFGKIFYGTDKLENCGKLMGLAAWGRVRLEHVDLLRRIAMEVFDKSRVTWQGYEGVNANYLRRSIIANLRLDPRQHEIAEIQDLAASAQELFRHELIASVGFGLTQVRSDLEARGLPAPKAMLYSGGCGLSVVTNGALRKAIGMPLIVAPYAHDSAQFVGAAVYASLKTSHEPFPLGKGWSGIPAHTEGEVNVQQIAAGGLVGAAVKPRRAAELLLSGRLIAYVSGGAEAGPRALGHRSLLANALDPAIRDRLNLEVKKREWYRPFAPMVLADDFRRYFAEPASPCATYMLDAYCLVPQYRNLLSAVSSPDGVSRPQAIGHGKDQDPWLCDLLREMAAITGHPVILNTSLNAPGMPIALNASQVLLDCEKLDLDAVICDGVLLSRRSQLLGASRAV